MCNCLKNQKGLVTLLAFSLTNLIFCQSPVSSSNISNNSFDKVTSGENLNLKKGNLGIEISAYILPPAKITKYEGNYKLSSRLQSAYEFGINHTKRLKNDYLISSGIYGIIGKWNFFADIPSEDLSQYDVNGKSIIWGEDIWGAIKAEVLIEKLIKERGGKSISIKMGLGLRYSGFMTDVLYGGGGILDSNNRIISLFEGEFSGRNDGKPWLTYIAGVSKLLTLNNYNILSIGVKCDISFTNFFEGSYTITIPNKPVSTGSYKFSGTSLGISIKYVFTGANKHIIRSYQKE